VLQHYLVESYVSLVFTVATPKYAHNDAPATMKQRDVTAERLLRIRATFCESLVVSVDVSKL